MCPRRSAVAIGSRRCAYVLLCLGIFFSLSLPAQPSPADIQFVRQGVRRFVFDEAQQLPLARLNPAEVIGPATMFPASHRGPDTAHISFAERQLSIRSEGPSETCIWLGGFNPFATYTLQVSSLAGKGEIGFDFSSHDTSTRCLIAISFEDTLIQDVRLRVWDQGNQIAEVSIALEGQMGKSHGETFALQMLGSGCTLFSRDKGLPVVIAQSDVSTHIDLRRKTCLYGFQSRLYTQLSSGEIRIQEVASALTVGIGIADIRAITYENGEVYLDEGRLWYTVSIRGRALPHHLQGVLSMDPTLFDLRLEGIIVFDRGDGLLRNEVASHLFFDRRAGVWRGLTTGFSAYANPEEEKQLLAIESPIDPRKGFSVMQAVPFGMIGDIEDPHILFDEDAQKWRMLTCENLDGYKAIMLESDQWDRGYKRIAGPVMHNSTGTSIQKIGARRYCFSGSSEREVFLYTYPDLREVGTLEMDLPPWSPESGTRVWPNVVQLPEGYPFRYVALMMDRWKYPGIGGPHWTYGAVYLYHGYVE